MTPRWKILAGDVMDCLKQLDEKSVNCCVTSPPYWRLRDYGNDGQLGMEPTIGEYIEKMTEVFSAVHRVLKNDGTLWLNMGDSYVAGGAWGGGGAGNTSSTWKARVKARTKTPKQPGLKRKDMVGAPWRLALALQADVWYLRSDIIWHRPNPMPESVKDRPTKSYEHIFLLSKRPQYFYDQDAVNQPVTGNSHPRGGGINKKIRVQQAEISRAFNRKRKAAPQPRQNPSFSAAVNELVDTRNLRDVWTIPTQPRAEAHFASFPDEIPRRCILAGCPRGGTVLDPFVGRGTTVIVALRNGRNAIGIDLNPEYCEMARKNIADDAPLFNGRDMSISDV